MQVEHGGTRRPSHIEIVLRYANELREKKAKVGVSEFQIFSVVVAVGVVQG